MTNDHLKYRPTASASATHCYGPDEYAYLPVDPELRAPVGETDLTPTMADRLHAVNERASNNSNGAAYLVQTLDGWIICDHAPSRRLPGAYTVICVRAALKR